MSISKIVQGLLTGDIDEPRYKSVTIRLPVSSYTRLAVLSRRLGQTPSGLLAMLSEDTIETAVSAYMSAQPEDSSEPEDFYSDVQESIIDHIGG
jgi:predicted DNA-binding protein